ncbi:hypothetical protein [Mycobacterium sp. M23085]
MEHFTVGLTFGLLAYAIMSIVAFRNLHSRVQRLESLVPDDEYDDENTG